MPAKVQVLKNSCVCIAALSFGFGFDMRESCLGRRAKKLRGVVLRHSVLEMYFLLGQRCTKGNYGCNSRDVLCVKNLLAYCQLLRQTPVKWKYFSQWNHIHTCWVIPPMTSTFFLDRMTWMTQREVWFLSALLHIRPSPCSSSWPRQSRETSSRLHWRQMKTW